MPSSKAESLTRSWCTIICSIQVPDTLCRKTSVPWITAPSLRKPAVLKMGIIVIRVLAKGALTDTPPKATGSENTLSPGSDYAVDLQRAQKLKWLVSGDVTTFPQAAIRFALSNSQVSTVLVGFSELSHVEQAVSCSGAGGLSDQIMGRLRSYWESDFSKTA